MDILSKVGGRMAIAGVAALLMSGSAVSSKAAEAPAAPAAQPNIIVIFADDLGYADNSLYEGGRFSTPNIERLAKSGVRFTAGYASAPVCAPSRAGLMTGRYQERFGYEYNNGPAKRDAEQGLGMATGERTIADYLKSAGYHTGMIGKWHLGSQERYYPMNRGFDEFVGFLPGESAYIDPKTPGLHASYGPTVGDEVLSTGTVTQDMIDKARTALNLPASVGDNVIRRRIEKIAKTFSRGEANQIVEGADHTVIHNDKEYLTDYFGDRAVDFIQRNSKKGSPYFLYLAFNAPHSPHMVTAKYYDRFPQIKDHQVRVYAAMISALDDQVGRVLDAVQASGQSGNTLIVFASDNGCEMYFPGLCSCAPLRGGKLSHYEGGVRIPFAIRWPGHIKPNSVYKDPVSTMDVLPTSVAAAGGKLPTTRAFDGVDLMPYLDGKDTAAPHDKLFWLREPLISLRDGDWKLWESNDKTGEYGNYKMLFDLKKDLNETTNLADQHPEKVKELEAIMNDWRKGMSEPQFPSKKPATFDVCGKTMTLPI